MAALAVSAKPIGLLVDRLIRHQQPARRDRDPESCRRLQLIVSSNFGGLLDWQVRAWPDVRTLLAIRDDAAKGVVRRPAAACFPPAGPSRDTTATRPPGQSTIRDRSPGVSRSWPGGRGPPVLLTSDLAAPV